MSQREIFEPLYFFGYQQFSWMLSNRVPGFQIVGMNQEALKNLLGMDSNLFVETFRKQTLV